MGHVPVTSDPNIIIVRGLIVRPVLGPDPGLLGWDLVGPAPDRPVVVSLAPVQLDALIVYDLKSYNLLFCQNCCSAYLLIQPAAYHIYIIIQPNNCVYGVSK